MFTHFFNLGFEKENLAVAAKAAPEPDKSSARTRKSSWLLTTVITVAIVSVLSYIAIPSYHSYEPVTAEPQQQQQGADDEGDNSGSDKGLYQEGQAPYEPPPLPVYQSPDSAAAGDFPLVYVAFLSLIGLAIALGLLSALLHALRKLHNPLYWQISCWILITIGIFIRPMVISGDPDAISIEGILFAAVFALALFPVLMRALNKLKPEPGLSHVALPFALGFFLDIAQLTTLTYIPDLKFLGV